MKKFLVIALALATVLSVTPVYAFTFNYNLTVGSRRAPDVSELQQFLKDQGTSIYPAGLVTGYFGPLTRAATAAFQAAHGITPPAGYFGPITRAYVNSMGVATPTPAPTPTPTETGSPTPTPPPSGTLTISAAAQNPVANDMPINSSYVSFMAIKFANGASSAVTVTGLKFLRGGLSADTDLNSIHLFDGITRLATMTYFSQAHKSEFTGLNIVVPVNGEKTIWVKGDIAAGVTVGKTINLSLAAVDVTATAGVTVEGSVAGNNMRVAQVTNPALATLQIQSIASGTQVNAGTTGFLTGAFTLQANNSAVNVSMITVTNVGSISNTDLANIKLMDGTTQIGSTVATLDANSKAVFDLSAAPVTMASGSNKLINVYADVLGTPNRNYRLTLQNTYDIMGTDTTYNVGVTPAVVAGGNGNGANNFPVWLGSAANVNIAVLAGTLTETMASDSPTGNVANGITNVTLAKFSMKANGEPIKLLQVPFTVQLGAILDFSAGANAAALLADCDAALTNFRMVGDDGSQVGNTITNCTAGFLNNGNPATFATGVPSTYTASFGSTANPVNYVIPANVTRVMSLKADLSQLLAQAGQTITGNLGGLLAAGQGTISLSNVNLVPLIGRTLNVINVPFAGALNGAVGTLQAPVGASMTRIASFILSAGAGEGLNLQTITVTLPNNALIPTDFSNVRMKVGGNDFGLVQSSVTAAQAITFAGVSTVAIPVGASVVVEMYANISSAATAPLNWVPAVTLTNAQATGAVSGTSRNITGNGAATAGQTFAVAAWGGLTASNDSGTQAATQYYMGATNVTFGSFKLTTGTIEGVNISAITLTDTMRRYGLAVNATSALYDIALWDGSTQVGTTQPSIAQNGTVTFNITGAGYAIDVSTTKTLMVKASVSAFNSITLVSNSTHQWGVTAITAIGGLSNANIVTGGLAQNVNAQTILRSTMTVATATNSPYNGHTVNAQDPVAIFNFTANGSDALLNRLFLSNALPATIHSTNTPLGVAYRLKDASGYIDNGVTGGTAPVVGNHAVFATTVAGDVLINNVGIGAVNAPTVAAGRDNFVAAINAQTANTNVAATSTPANLIVLYRVTNTGLIAVSGNSPTSAGLGVAAAAAAYRSPALVLNTANATIATGASTILINGVDIATGNIGADGDTQATLAAAYAAAINALTGTHGVTAGPTSVGNAGRLILARNNPGNIELGGANLALMFGATAALSQYSGNITAIDIGLPANYTITAGSANLRPLTIEVNSLSPQFFVGGAAVGSFNISTGNDNYLLQLNGISYSDQGNVVTDLTLPANAVPISANTLSY